MLQYNQVSESKAWVTTERSKLKIFILGPESDMDVGRRCLGH